MVLSLLFAVKLANWEKNREDKRHKLLMEEAEQQQQQGGKTMPMDMFYGATEGIVKHRQRFHFHDHEVNFWLAAEERNKQVVQMKNILPAVADKFLVDQQADNRGASILCFDEIQDYEEEEDEEINGEAPERDAYCTYSMLIFASDREMAVKASPDRRMVEGRGDFGQKSTTLTSIVPSLQGLLLPLRHLNL
ncbi:hypothetical protein Ddye_007430 [Dipteronia dyeriana]|uniref:Uncharacterized protein n=1 Tax=Dipteronia dyeriana TaxID=168575 RepID=A0AAE0CRM0_9ROSI|nr:hypothetical protein Ddye_007430 [Dipteronia dyeriana]